ncbi:MAG TPA: polysaccharide deacetylase family protein [Methylomirabilota bacterium]|nr:polysaccharide deacetylase family protein [Methylomirabilota bacterium]
MSAARRTVLVAALLLAAAGCSTTRSAQTPGERAEPTSPAGRQPGPAAKDSDVFESKDFIVTVARAGDTPESLAARHLGDPKKKWMIEDYMGTRTLSAGQEVVIPKHEWNPVGVFPWGYQLVPVLVYHNIAAQDKGRLTLAVRSFDAQIRQLHADGFQALRLADFLAYTTGRRQLPRKSVLLTFDDGYKSFVQYARPILKDYGYGATLFVYSDFLGGGSALSWQDLRTLTEQGFDVQAHSKSHANLRRAEGESEAAYAKRIEAELAFPNTLYTKHLGRPFTVLAYPFGEMDDELLPYVAKFGYSAAFTVRRQSNPAFVSPLRISRAQIYSEMTAKDFTKNLIIFQDEEVKLARTADGRVASVAQAQAAPTQPAAGTPVVWAAWDRLAASHNEKSEQLEKRGFLRQALEERTIALTIAPGDRKAQDAHKRLETQIAKDVAGLLQEGRALLDRGVLGEAQQRFLTALSLEPTNRPAFEALQNDVREVLFITHTVRPGDTCVSLAELYYGDKLRCEVIAETNRMALNAQLKAGQKIRVPEIPGVPFRLP